MRQRTKVPFLLSYLQSFSSALSRVSLLACLYPNPRAALGADGWSACRHGAGASRQDRAAWERMPNQPGWRGMGAQAEVELMACGAGSQAVRGLKSSDSRRRGWRAERKQWCFGMERQIRKNYNSNAAKIWMERQIGKLGKITTEMLPKLCAIFNSVFCTNFVQILNFDQNSKISMKMDLTLSCLFVQNLL